MSCLATSLHNHNINMASEWVAFDIALSHHLYDSCAIDVDSVVIDHLHDGHAQVAPDAEGDAEAKATEDGNDVAFGQPTTAAVQQRGISLGHGHRPPVLCQLHQVFVYITPINLPVMHNRWFGNKVWNI